MKTAAEEKALSLFDWYYSAICDLIPVADGYERASRYNAVKPKAKQCALIAVNLKIESYNSMYKDVDKLAQLISGFKTEEDFNDNLSYIKDRELKPYLIQKIMYWQDVKREIEKL
jgi:hypothetical protein